MVRSIAHAVNVTLLVGFFAVSIWAFESLPTRIPSHFGLGGAPDAYWATTMGRWLLLPFVALAVTAGLYGLAWAAGHGASVMNVPDRARYRALPASGQAEVVAMVQRYVYWTAAAMTVLLAILQYAVYLGSLTVLGLVGGVLIIAGLLLSAYGLHRAMGRRVDALHARAPSADERAE